MFPHVRQAWQRRTLCGALAMTAVSADFRTGTSTVAYCIGCEYAMVCIRCAVRSEVIVADLGVCGAGAGLGAAGCGEGPACGVLVSCS